MARIHGKWVCQGEIWWYNPPPDLPEIHGILHGRRPVLIISNNAFNRGSSNVVNCLPLSRIEKLSPVHVFLERYDETKKQPQGSLFYSSYVLCEQAMTVSQSRLQTLVGRVTYDEWREVRKALDFQYGAGLQD